MSRKEKRVSILVVDDAADTLELLKRNLVAKDYRVFTAPGVRPAIGILESTPIDLVVTDLKMPEVSGLDLVRHVRENYRQTAVIMITGYASISGAVEAVKSGADDYLAKPFTDEELYDAVSAALEKLLLRRAGHHTSEPKSPEHYGIIGDSPGMKEVYVAIDKAASTSATVLITGESGTGKELVSRAIHYNSMRAAAPFVPVNCGGIPETLLESELFGHVKGAFTGASQARAGFFQTADGGTIFLDEIGDMSLNMQVKLLRVLEDKEVCMVGSSRPRSVDVRIVAATNKDLWSQVQKGEFRDDLFYRLNVLTIIVPPLRKRHRDIVLLANHFATKFAREADRTTPEFSEDALQVLMNYGWPGNVRELENVVQRIVVMSDTDVIEVPDLPSLMRFSALRRQGFDRTLAEVEQEYIQNVLDSVGGNKSRAAEILGIDRKTLREKLRRAEGEEQAS